MLAIIIQLFRYSGFKLSLTSHLITPIFFLKNGELKLNLSFKVIK